MDRRTLLMASLGLVMTPVAADAQPTGKVYRIGILSSGLAAAPPIEAFRRGLLELGWVEGQNIVIDYRITEGTSWSTSRPRRRSA